MFGVGIKGVFMRTSYKFVVIVFICNLLIALTACTSFSSETSSMFSTNVTKNETIEENEHYAIYYSDFMYSYYIFDKNHHIVKSDTSSSMPHIMVLDDSLIRVTIQSGTGIETQWGYYYNLKNDTFSEIFHCIYDQTNDKVAFGGLNKVIIQDIYDKGKYYQEISSFTKPFSEVAAPIISAKFIDNGTNIKVSYLSGSNYEEVSEIVKTILD